YMAPGFGLVLGGAAFTKSAGSAKFGVIGDARVDQIFVPYAAGSPRYYDTDYNFPLAVIPQTLCGSGVLLDGGLACLEVRDRDIDWLHEPNGAGPIPGRRGEEAVLWSVLAAANYLYIEEWGFRDDGVFW